jgi:hypothetical protein
MMDNVPHLKTELYDSSRGTILLQNNNLNLIFKSCIFCDCLDWRTDYDGSRDV